jgi:hypothetical protein
MISLDKILEIAKIVIEKYGASVEIIRNGADIVVNLDFIDLSYGEFNGKMYVCIYHHELNYRYGAVPEYKETLEKAYEIAEIMDKAIPEEYKCEMVRSDKS